ncbi:orotidine-5'-phosphate decarboxylase [Alphaproteobacteria bacterium]|nr:orotidine-5'-phosphate decarboxylase [Alphaproteobacteria bacterium]
MNKKIIVALDIDEIDKALKLVKEIKKEVYAFKIGHEFFYNFGIRGYKKIYNICPKIFLDLKLHDIPNTVQKGLKAMLKLKPIFTTIHISGGDDMQKKSVLKNNKKTNILGVTILTSLDEKQTLKYYKEKNVSILVKKFANYAKKNNLDGLVCSPLEISIVRKEVGEKMILVVPGIRTEKNSFDIKDDQKRTLTPKEAINLGADFLVIGRPIIESKNPLETIKKINQSIILNDF